MMCLACGDHHNSIHFVENPSDTQAIKYLHLNSASHLANPENVAKYHSDLSPQTHRRTLNFWWIACAKMNTRFEVASKALAFQWISSYFTHRATMDGDISAEVSNCDPLVVFFFSAATLRTLCHCVGQTLTDYRGLLGIYVLLKTFSGTSGLFNPGIFCFHLLLLNFIGGKFTLQNFHVSH